MFRMWVIFLIFSGFICFLIVFLVVEWDFRKFEAFRFMFFGIIVGCFLGLVEDVELFVIGIVGSEILFFE